MNILFLAHRVPFPPDRGDRIRGYHIVRHLAERARVHLVAFADSEAEAAVAPEFRDLFASCAVVPRARSRARAAAEALLTAKPLSLTAFADARIAAAIEQVGAVNAAYVFSGQMAQYLPVAAGRTVMDFVDLDSVKFAAYAADARGPMRWMYTREARLLGAFERRVAAQVDASLFVSAAEAALLPGARVLENGIDAARYDPARVRPVAERGPLIVFTGQMDYPPNIDATRWFARAVLPTVRAAYPQARFAIVGRAPTAAVRALAGEGVIVTGEVDDVRPWLAAAAAVVVPLRIARGVQNKVLEAMAMARPVVASPAAAEGIDHRGTIRVADGASAFVAAVSALLDRPTSAPEARAQVLARYAWPARLAPLDVLLGLPQRRQAA